MNGVNGVGGPSPVSGHNPAPEAPPGFAPDRAMRLSAPEQAQMDALAARAAGGDAVAEAELSRRAEGYHAREMHRLASDVYNVDTGYRGEDGARIAAPEGWTRAAGADLDDPAIRAAAEARLAAYGLTVADLNPEGQNGFRAELYIPDRAVLGEGAQPVLSFKGTTPTRAEDWATNLAQGVGAETEYYNRAMIAADRLNRVTDGGFEVTGHSLGGGLASAASAVTGARATTFNPAGLHAETAARFLEGRGVAPADAMATTTAYVVKGEILNALPPAMAAMDPQNADAAVSLLQDGLGHAETVAGLAEKAEALGARADRLSDSWLGRRVLGDDTRARIDDAVAQLRAVSGQARRVADLTDAAGGLMTATGADLRAMPPAAGRVVTMDAVNADGTPRPPALGENDPAAVTDAIEASVAEAGAIRRNVEDRFATLDRRLGPVDDALGLDLEGAGEDAGKAAAALSLFRDLGGVSGGIGAGKSAVEAGMRHLNGPIADALDHHIHGAR